MRQNPLFLVFASLGFAAAVLAPAFWPSVAQERPAVVAQGAAAPAQASNPAGRTIDDTFRHLTVGQWVLREGLAKP